MAAAAGSDRHFKCVKTNCLHIFHLPLSKNILVMCEIIMFTNLILRSDAQSSHVFISSLRSHMRRKHRHEVEFENDLNDHTQEDDVCDIACEDVSQTDCNKDKMDGQDISVKEMALFALKTQEFNRLSDTATDTKHKNTCQLPEQNEEHLKAQVKACIEKTGFDLKDIEGLEELLKSRHDNTASMKQLKTSKDRNKYLRESLNMVVSNSSLLTSKILAQLSSYHTSKATCSTSLIYYVTFYSIPQLIVRVREYL